MADQYDWEAGFEHYASLPPGERSYDKVSQLLGCQPRAVERASLRKGWAERLAQIDAKARAAADKKLVRARAERVADTLRIIDASRTKFAGQLGRSDFRLTGSDFVGLIKLEQLLEGESTENVAMVEVQAGFRTAMEVAIATVEMVAGEVMPATKAREFVKAYRLRFLPAVNEALAVGPG